MADETTTHTGDAAQQLAQDDPESQELQRLVEYLGIQGIQLDDLAAVEASLAEPAEDLPVEATQTRAGGDGPRARRHRDERDAAQFEAAGEHQGAQGLEVIVSDDRLCATVLHIDSEVTLAEVAAALKHHKVRHGLRVDAIKAAVARARAGEVLDDVLVARGEPPRPGRDAAFDWAVSVGGRSGTVLADGSIDLRDRRLIAVVKEGDLLGRLLPADPGQSGRDVLGRALTPPPAQALEVVAGAGVRAEEEAAGAVAYYATAEGGVTHEESQSKGRRQLRIALTSVSRIERDVDYATGNIDFQGDVVIDGSVKALFRVRASGTVTIGDSVEAGACVQAGGDILVSGGVVGAETQLDAGGSVMAKFVQSAKVHAGGNVEVGAYLFDADLRCRGQLTVAGKGEGSGRALVGGLVWAAKGIESSSLGSESNPHVRLVVGIDPDLVAEAERLRARVRAVEKEETRLLRALGVKRLDASQIKKVLGQAKGADQRARQVEAVRKLTQLGEVHKQAHERLEQIAQAQRQLAGQAALVVSGPVFAGAELRLGEYIHQVRDEARGVRFRLVEEEGETAIQMQEA